MKKLIILLSMIMLFLQFTPFSQAVAKEKPAVKKDFRILKAILCNYRLTPGGPGIAAPFATLINVTTGETTTTDATGHGGLRLKLMDTIVAKVNIPGQGWFSTTRLYRLEQLGLTLLPDPNITD
ncbi:hypothetical protein AY601_1463 [Pedobacter cryoconitis]|uniref:Uncharacterized protein n=1 Tax=Pedobacter cryoconitis TaxID=188932 RepID=A0A127VAZ1_9SPHI|nr:hypothetical protein [Pedobacter cryoconitis]AMP98380.1 hypothetical protein AY601_1463 [Pedobacter cryoconitis]